MTVRDITRPSRRLDTGRNPVEVNEWLTQLFRLPKVAILAAARIAGLEGITIKITRRLVIIIDVDPTGLRHHGFDTQNPLLHFGRLENAYRPTCQMNLLI